MNEIEINTQGGAANVLPPPPSEIPIPKKPRKKREGRKLTWNERQYGAGFINGVWVGIAAGFVVVPIVAAACKLFVGWLFTW